jgi:hypothetical protein
MHQQPMLRSNQARTQLHDSCSTGRKSMELRCLAIRQRSGSGTSVSDGPRARLATNNADVVQRQPEQTTLGR